MDNQLAMRQGSESVDSTYFPRINLTVAFHMLTIQEQHEALWRAWLSNRAPKESRDTPDSPIPKLGASLRGRSRLGTVELLEKNIRWVGWYL